MNRESSNAEPDALPDADYAAFEREFEALSGIKLALYKEKQMKRRIGTLIARRGLGGYEGLLDALKAGPAELKSFTDYITINVTEFFRTPEHWQVFESKVLRELADQSEGELKIWSCACATGEEAYSAAMSLNRMLPPPRYSILATDIDDKVLSFAQEGAYPEKSLEGVPEELLETCFTGSGAVRRIKDSIKEHVRFAKLDLLKDRYPENCDLIICRNVLIYFTEEAKDCIYRRVNESLRPGGYLFTGNVEQIIWYRKYGFEKLTGYLYRKI